jgi:hypothetical protein
MNKNTRIKSFKGLPHSLGGLDYTDDAEVEHNENAYRPLGSDNEFIFRNTSIHTKELEKEDKLRKNRPVGDRISDQSFDNAAQKIIMKEIKDLIKEGKNPFNTEGQNAFKQGGVKYKYESGGTNRLDFEFTPTSDPRLADPGRYSTPTIDNNAVQPSNSSMSTAGDIAGYAALASNIGSQFITGGEQYEKPLSKEVGTMQTTGDAVAGAVGVPFYQETKAISNLGDQLSNKGMSEDNQALTRTGDFIEGIDTFGTRMKSIDAADKGIITKGENVGIQALSFLGGPWGQMALGEKEKEYYDKQEKQVGYDTTLAARDRFEGSPETTRTRYNDQVQMKNGGVRKQYGGKFGSVRPIDPPYAEEPMMAAQPMTEEDFYTPYINPDINDPIRAFTTAPGGAYAPSNTEEYTTAPVDPVTAINEEYTTAPDGAITDKKGKKLTSDQIKQLYQGILGFGANAAGSIAYLASEGKNYDKVKYPTYRPENMTAETQLREARDQSASTIEALRQQGKLDPAALEQLATSGSKATAGIRENVANFNIGNRNQAQQFNIGTDIRGQQDEAANKGQALTNYYEAIGGVGNAVAGTTRQANMIDNDKMILAMYENVFGKNKVV